MSDASLDEILKRISDSTDWFSAGPVSAVTLALSASLAVAVASTLRDEENPDAVEAQAEVLRDRALELAERNRRDLERARLALAPGAGKDDRLLLEALEQTLENLQDLAGCAADVATILVEITGKVDASSEPDLVSAVVLAEAVAVNALKLAEANLLHMPERPVTEAIRLDRKIAASARERLLGES